jgi:hypothetical protein
MPQKAFLFHFFFFASLLQHRMCITLERLRVLLLLKATCNHTRQQLHVCGLLWASQGQTAKHASGANSQ